MSQTEFPPGWDAERARRVLAHYDEQTKRKRSPKTNLSLKTRTMMVIPNEIVPAVRELIAKRET